MVEANPVHDDIGVEDGMCTGEIMYEADDGTHVRAHANSYTYEKNGEAKTNHVPMATLCDETGTIQLQHEGHDTDNPKTANKRARKLAESFAERNLNLA